MFQGLKTSAIFEYYFLSVSFLYIKFLILNARIKSIYMFKVKDELSIFSEVINKIDESQYSFGNGLFSQMN